MNKQRWFKTPLRDRDGDAHQPVMRLGASIRIEFLGQVWDMTPEDARDLAEELLRVTKD